MEDSKMTKTGSRKIGILLAVLICLSAWLSVGAFASESPAGGI